MTSNKVVRRVQLTGGSTFIVSIPKEWAEKLSIGKGSLLVLSLENDGSIRIVPSLKRPEALSSAEVSVREDTTRGAALREVMSKYLMGYKMIRVVFERDDPEFRHVLKDTIARKLIGVEILHEDSREVVLQVLVNVEDLPVSTIITKMRDAVTGMLEDVKAALGGGDVEKIASEIVSRDDIVDKLYLYGLRQLHAALRGYVGLEEIGLRKVEEVLPHGMVLKNIERIADHAASIAQALPHVREAEKIKNPISTLSDKVSEFFTASVHVFLDRDKTTANRLLDVDAEKLKALERKVFDELARRIPEEILAVRLMVGSYRRIFDYSTDILEATIDLHDIT
ncbi:phosphate uptake regulator PhoU [Thermofilum pendens]|nr:phosphate uptake regulator PhoU [Thermofilum pendens]